MIRVLEPGPLATVQDGGRHGYAHLGVPAAGPLDPPAARLANRLVGNHEDAALIESLLGDLAVELAVELGTGRWVAVTGAPAEVTREGRPAAHSEAFWVPAGARVRLGRVTRGMRCYLAVGGGVAVDPVLGSRSTDTLAWVGPGALAEGTELPVGPAPARPAAADVPARRRTGSLRVHPGPQADWFDDDVLRRLYGVPWTVSEQSNRVGLRLQGEALVREARELPSQGMVTGSIQVPADGQPVVFLADHPPTGGYPVIGVVASEDLWQCAQVRPGETLRFTPALAQPPGSSG